MSERLRGVGDRRKQIGQEAEAMAVQYLLQAGYEIVEQNWHIRSGEIDIIAKHDKTLVFVEVRSRHVSKRFGTAEESVDVRKQIKVRRTAEVYLMQHALSDVEARFDVIGIERCSNQMKLRHITNAF